MIRWGQVGRGCENLSWFIGFTIVWSQVIGVEPEDAAGLTLSMKAGQVIPLRSVRHEGKQKKRGFVLMLQFGFNPVR